MMLITKEVEINSIRNLTLFVHCSVTILYNARMIIG